MPTGVTLRILTKAGFEPGLSDSFHSARCLLPRSECSFCTFQVLTKRPLENWITRYSRSQLRYSIPVHKCSWEKFFLVLTAKTLEFFVLVDKESFLFSVVHVFTETMNHWHLSQSRFLARDLRALGSATGWDPAASLLCLHSPRTSWHYCHFSNQLLCNPFFWKFLIFCLLFQVHLNPTWKLTGVENISRSNKAAYLWLCNGIVVHWWSLLIFSKSLTRTVKTYFSLSQHARRCKWYEW